MNFNLIGKHQNLKPLLIQISGESNSGGWADTPLATAEEQLINPLLKIWNTSISAFSDWDVTRSLRGHLTDTPSNGLIVEGASTYVKHGWDLMISNLTKTNYFGGRKIFVVKTGAGSSRIAQWAPGSYYATTFETRLAAARAAIGEPHDVIMMYTQGINDSIAGTDAATWKTQTKARFEAIRALLPNVPIALTLIEAPILVAPSYNQQIDEIANEMTGIYPVNTLNLDFDGAYHWNYNGMKTIAQRMLNKLLNK